jgi:uncharacterized protein
MPNRLAGETSPYLLQHAHNPVDWYPWGSEALERARREDRPIFLSIGYAACHWCHVMERESFEDVQTAELMNREFIAIKVDREERPDLDEVYMAAVQAMTGSGGWPMSVFLTPDLEPFFGGTYFPPQDGHGLPGFPRVLTGVADAYRTRRSEVAQQGRQLAAYLREQMAPPAGNGALRREQLAGAVRRLVSTFDPVLGGFGAAPKFPAPMTLEFLLRAWRQDRDSATLEMVTRTLHAMADGGIHDQLAGGFARYSTDARWLVPHFEKMLYDNAQLAHCYLEAWRATGEARFRAVTESTLDFCLRELVVPDGGFASALDADTEGEEGRFYAWTSEQATAVLGAAGLSSDQVEAVAAFWDITNGGNWEGRCVLHVAGPAPDADLVELARAALLAAREARVRPARDDKQLAAWNGLMLRALAAGAGALGRSDYLAATAELAAFIRRSLVRSDGGVWRTARNGRGHTPGFLEDYACLADGLLAAHAALGGEEDLILARDLMDRAIGQFWDEETGTFWDTSDEHDALVARPHSLIDGATPAGNSVAADVLQRLALVTADPDYDRRARSILGAVAAAFDSQPSAFGRMLSAADRALNQPVDAVIAEIAAGDEDAATSRVAAQALRSAALRRYAPDLLVATLPLDSHLAGWSLFEGKAPVHGVPTAYVCRGYACEAPTDDPTTVERQVGALG